MKKITIRYKLTDQNMKTHGGDGVGGGEGGGGDSRGGKETRPYQAGRKSYSIQKLINTTEKEKNNGNKVINSF